MPKKSGKMGSNGKAVGKSNGKAKKKARKFLPDRKFKLAEGDPTDVSVDTMPAPMLRNLREVPEWLSNDIHEWLQVALHLIPRDPALAQAVICDVIYSTSAVGDALETGTLFILGETQTVSPSQLARAARKILLEDGGSTVEEALAARLLERVEGSAAAEGAS